MIKQFLIVNKSGGMIYKYEANPTEDLNTLLILTSTIHSLNEISRNVLNTDYFLQEIICETLQIYIYRTLTNTTFIFVSDKPVQKEFLKIYSEYSDFVMSNPFHSAEMPINLVKFNPSKFFTL